MKATNVIEVPEDDVADAIKQAMESSGWAEYAKNVPQDPEQQRKLLMKMLSGEIPEFDAFRKELFNR